MNEMRSGPEPLSISVVVPTYHRPDELKGLLENLCHQTVRPREVIVVDGTPRDDDRAEQVVASLSSALPYRVVFVKGERGTAVQRNNGIERASSQFIAFLDDDIRLEPDFFEAILRAFEADDRKEVGGIVGYRTNEHFRLEDAQRWRWYRRLRLFTTYEPGAYDFKSGYPINAKMQAPFSGVRGVDFMTTACAVWRREVLDGGLRFDRFFRDYGVLEDAHFSLRAGRSWKLLQCGDARCVHLASPNGRVDRRKLGYKYVVNYYYVFQDVARPLSRWQRVRFWRFQVFELIRMTAAALNHRNREDLLEVQGRLSGFKATLLGSGRQS
jgi:GT2 family glycosyltransferase